MKFMKKLTYAVPAVALVLALSGAGVASAQSVYSFNGHTYNVPAGFTPYAYGVYYGSSAGVYYDPVTGQTSAIAPAGPAQLSSDSRLGVSNGLTYAVPNGYTNATAYGTFYNPSTGMYLDPATGFTSTSAPSGPLYFQSNNSTGSTGLPNTGAGGDLPFVLAILAAALVAGLLGASSLTRRAS